MNALLDLFRPGRSIYLPGASGEILALAEALTAEPTRLAAVNLTSCLLPGFNSFDYAALHSEASLSTFLLPPALRGSFETGNTRLIPLPYSSIARHIEQSGFDVGVFHVAPPDENGLCSVGIAADFPLYGWRTAQCRVLVVNSNMPRVRTGLQLDTADADLIIELESPLVTTSDPEIDPVADAVAQRVAELVPDGATVQMGIGGAPSAVWQHLTGHKNLTIASGMATAGWQLLRDANALRPGPVHRAGVMLGTQKLYDDLSRQDWLTLEPVGKTHDSEALGRISHFYAINSALEIDLFGQANVEWRNGRLVSGIGGAGDFARGAMLSSHGRSIIALPATARDARTSRIVARITAPSISLSRDQVDVVVTQFGIAELQGKSLQERANALINVAAPEHQDTLRAEWRDMITAI